MTTVTIKGSLYDTDDIIGKCYKCGSHYFDQPSLIHLIKTSLKEKAGFNSLQWGVAYCPQCNDVTIWEGPDKKIVY